MLPETHPLIDSITRPLDDNPELKLSAAQILREKFDPDHVSVPEMLERLEKEDKKKFPALGRIVLWFLAVVGLGIGIYSGNLLLTSINMIRIYADIELFDSEKFTLPEGLTTQEKILLGDPELDLLRQKELLLESDPANPAYYAEYAQAYLDENGQLPYDFLETAERIDPENSFFLYWAAAVIIGDSLEKLPKTSPEMPRYVDGVKLPPLLTEQAYVITDRAAYDDALALIKKASELSRFDNYEIKMTRARMRLVSKVTSLTDFFRAIVVQFEFASVGVMSMVKVADLMNAHAAELSKNDNKEDFLSLATKRDAFILKWAHNENINLVSELVYRVIASSTALNFQAAAERLELTELAETYRKQGVEFNADRDYRRIRDRKDNETEAFFDERGSALSRISIPTIMRQVQSPPPLGDSDLKPLRMVEHEVLARFGIYFVGLGLLLAAVVVFLFRFIAQKNICLPAKRLASLLKLSDWIWIFSLGIVLPILLFLYINRLSPLSGRDYGAIHYLFVFPTIHLIVLLLNLLLIPAAVTRWRLTRRAAAFQFRSRWDLLSIPVIAVMIVYSFVVYPLVVKFNLSTMIQIGLTAPLVGWLGFVFFNSLRIILGNARSRLIQATTVIAVIPAYALAILALCLILPLYHAGEKHWITQDKLHLVDPDAPDLGMYECKVAAQMRKEINAIMGY